MSMTSLPPGFRFHPTNEELILHYLRNRATSIPCPVSIIAEVDIYKFDPWELPAKALFGDREWYFFSPRDRKYPNGIRPNRAAASGYWKATGTDKPVVTSNGNENIGVKKALVFYKGRPPKGVKTDWIMHEYRLPNQGHNTNTYKPNKLRDSSMRLDDWVLCRIYKKSNHQLVNSEQEESCVDDVQLIADTTINTNTNSTSISTQEINPLRLPKVCSLTELLEVVDCSALSRLLDINPPNMIGLDNCSTGYISQPLLMNIITNNIDHNELVQQMSQAEASCLVTENHLKRQRKLEDDIDVSHHAKKPMVPNIFNSYSNKFDGNQFSFLSQPFIGQQVLFNSHLGLH